MKKMFNQEGFILVITLPLILLSMTAFVGVFTMSLGIKNITQAKTICITKNLATQAKLKLSLEKLLSLNKPIKILYKIKQGLDLSLKAALVTGLIPVAVKLKKEIAKIKLKIKAINTKQQFIIYRADIYKQKQFIKFKRSLANKYIKSIKQQSFFGSALAIQKKDLEKGIFIYKPVPRFSEKQKTAFSWEMKPFLNFYPHEFSKYKCVATLEREGEKWKERLYH